MTTVALSDKRITELSSLTASKKFQVAWGCNDDPTSPDVFGINPFTGKTISTIDLSGAKLVDTEALDLSANSNITLGAIGDNKCERDYISAFIFPEPSPAIAHHSIKATEYRMVYPKKKRYNAETLVVHPITGEKFIWTKENGITRIFALPKTMTSKKGKVNELVLVDALPLSLVTDGSFTPDGRFLTLRQKGLFDTVTVVDWAEREILKPFKVDKVKQPEAIAVEWDSLHVLYGSEGKSSPLGRVLLPTEYQPAA